MKFKDALISLGYGGTMGWLNKKKEENDRERAMREEQRRYELQQRREEAKEARRRALDIKGQETDFQYWKKKEDYRNQNAESESERSEMRRFYDELVSFDVPKKEARRRTLEKFAPVREKEEDSPVADNNGLTNDQLEIIDSVRDSFEEGLDTKDGETYPEYFQRKRPERWNNLPESYRKSVDPGSGKGKHLEDLIAKVKGGKQEPGKEAELAGLTTKEGDTAIAKNEGKPKPGTKPATAKPEKTAMVPQQSKQPKQPKKTKSLIQTMIEGVEPVVDNVREAVVKGDQEAVQRRQAVDLRSELMKLRKKQGYETKGVYEDTIKKIWERLTKFMMRNPQMQGEDDLTYIKRMVMLAKDDDLIKHDPDLKEIAVAK